MVIERFEDMKIYASMLAANFCCLGDELRELSEADGIHWDIMDGHFVDSINFGAGIVKAHREITDQIFDVHLMVENPEKHIEDFVMAGADIITVHAEATKHIHKTLSLIKSFGKKAGIALNPATSCEFIPYVSDVLDIVLIMTVNPGKSHQSFIDSQLNKIRAVSGMIDSDIEICIDGGINDLNIAECIQAGADNFVVGSYIFQKDDYSDAIATLREKSL